MLDQPEDALRAVEQRPALPAVTGLDWPCGKAVQVRTAAPGALKRKLASTRGASAPSSKARASSS